jgi:tripartite-type tricarboxylate transporter receptor subunit TctC
MAETFEGFNVDSWYAMFAPANTPAAVINKMQAAVAKAAQDEGIKDAFLQQGAVVVGSSPDELDAIVKREIPMWKALAKDANIQIN